MECYWDDHSSANPFSSLEVSENLVSSSLLLSHLETGVFKLLPFHNYRGHYAHENSLELHGLVFVLTRRMYCGTLCDYFNYCMSSQFYLPHLIFSQVLDLHQKELKNAPDPKTQKENGSNFLLHHDSVCSQGGGTVVQLEGCAEQAHAASEGLCPVWWDNQRCGYRLHQEDLLPAPVQPNRRFSDQCGQWAV